MTADIIRQTVCQYFKIDFQDIVNYSSKPEHTIPRHFYCKLVKDEMGFSLARVGLTIDRDHATVLNSVKRINGFIESYAIFAKQYNDLLSQLNEQHTNLITELENLIPV